MFTLAVTDPRWHQFMLEFPQTGPLNFWTPTPWRPNLEVGSTFGFLVKSPHRSIGGFGRFEAYEEMSVDAAWARFRTANGVADVEDFRRRIVQFAQRRSTSPINTANPTIGCIVLEDCVFFPERQMVKPDAIGLSFPNQIVKYKGFDEVPDLTDRLGMVSQASDFELVEDEESARRDRSVKYRSSQGIFRENVLKAYSRRCSLSGEDCPTILEASHIQPFISLRSNHIQNGLCLRVDLHRLFDAGLISIGENHEVLMSPAVRSETVRQWSGKRLRIPNHPDLQPSRLALEFHRNQVFRV